MNMATRTDYSTWTPQKPTLFDGHYLRNRSTLDIGVSGYIGIFSHKEHSPEVLSIPPGTSCVYRVSQEECATLRESVPYVKVYRYNPKHLCPKLNGYGDNGQRKVCYSGGSTHCICQLTTISMIHVRPWVWCHITAIPLKLALNYLCTSFLVIR